MLEAVCRGTRSTSTGLTPWLIRSRVGVETGRRKCGFSSISLRFVQPELSLTVQLEKLEAERLGSKFIRCHVCIVVGIVFMGRVVHLWPTCGTILGPTSHRFGSSPTWTRDLVGLRLRNPGILEPVGELEAGMRPQATDCQAVAAVWCTRGRAYLGRTCSRRNGSCGEVLHAVQWIGRLAHPSKPIERRKL